MKAARKKTSRKKKLLLILFGVMFGLLMSEIFLRVIGYSYPIFYETDYYRGFALRPGIAGHYQREGESYVSVNSDGLRDREHLKTKPANTFRIALLGDSFTEAMQVPMEQTYWYLLDKKLNDCNAFPGKQVEIINFGVSGYGTAQELMTLREKVWAYSPDMVVLAFTTYNDIFDNARAISGNDDVPYFVYKNGELTLDASYRDSSAYQWHDGKLSKLGRWFHDHLRVIQLLHYVQFVSKFRLTDWRNRRKLAAEQQQQKNQPKPAPTASPQRLTPEQVGRDNMVYRAPETDDWREAWRVTEGLIKEMRTEVAQKNADFLLVTLSNAIQVYPNPVVRENFMKHMDIPTVFYPNQRLKALADSEGIHFFDLAEPMQRYADENKVFLHGFGADIGNGHWNAAGHQVVSNLLAQRICSDRAMVKP
jgi:lysophospholipase L1-like esterase